MVAELQAGKSTHLLHTDIATHRFENHEPTQL